MDSVRVPLTERQMQIFGQMYMNVQQLQRNLEQAKQTLQAFIVNTRDLKAVPDVLSAVRLDADTKELVFSGNQQAEPSLEE